MLKHIESFYLSTGRYSCYFDCLVNIAEQEMKKRGIDVQFDHNTLIQVCSFNKWITFNWKDYNDPANFDVNDGVSILNTLTGIKWEYRRVDSPDYKLGKNEYDIRRWKRSGVSGYHFNMDGYDPLQDSQTVRYGAVDGHRIFWVSGENGK